MPDEYILALGSENLDLDNVSLIDNAESIVEATLLYRNGFMGLEPWQVNLIYIGDEADACPYILNCNTGTVIRSEKGDIKKPPLAEFKNLNEFLSSIE